MISAMHFILLRYHHSHCFAVYLLELLFNYLINKFQFNFKRNMFVMIYFLFVYGKPIKIMLILS